MADLELNSIGNGDGNNYLLRDNSKIPLSGTSALAGNIVPSTDNAYDLGSSSKRFKNIYTCALCNPVTTSGLYLGYENNAGSRINFFGKDAAGYNGWTSIMCQDSTNTTQLLLKPDGTFSWSGTSIVPTGDGICDLGSTTKAFANIYGKRISQSVTNSLIAIDGGTDYTDGAELVLYGKDSRSPNFFGLYTFNSTNTERYQLQGIGSTLTWTGTAIQYVSDKRLKQQIAEIDDDLLTAWEDVNPVQFKYNDAVDQKGKDKARLHTGYVVQQIDEACKKHNVDVSAYGLYCHEEYPERTEEVTIENEDGTTSKETKVIEETSEHYSLRYTETLVVECAYLRRENTRLKTRLNSLESRLEQIEQSLK